MTDSNHYTVVLVRESHRGTVERFVADLEHADRDDQDREVRGV